MTGKFNPSLPESFFLHGMQIHLQQTVHDENDACHQGDHDTGNKNHVDDPVVLMVDIPDFRISTDLFPQHDDLQEPKVSNIGR